jgi:hypothetical protein
MLINTKPLHCTNYLTNKKRIFAENKNTRYA